MADPREKDYKREKVNTIHLDGTLDEVISYLSETRLELEAAGWIDLELEQDWGDYNSTYELWGWRPLTEKEKEKIRNKKQREAAARKKAKQDKEDRERREYERLRLKYDPPAPLSKRSTIVDL